MVARAHRPRLHLPTTRTARRHKGALGAIVARALVSKVRETSVRMVRA